MTDWNTITIAGLCIIVAALLVWNLYIQRRVKRADNKEITAIVQDIRKALRAEHQRIGILFKDLDSFVAELPDVLSSKQEEKPVEPEKPKPTNFKRFRDYDKGDSK